LSIFYLFNVVFADWDNQRVGNGVGNGDWRKSEASHSPSPEGTRDGKFYTRIQKL
jgi:hypothetical protein